jgi:CheY-like chemotaxis protein
VAKNGKQGVEMATMNLPDIILSDIMMPDLDGYGVLYLLNKNPETTTIPFILLLQNQNELICVKEWKWVPMIILQNHLAG